MIMLMFFWPHHPSSQRMINDDGELSFEAAGGGLFEIRGASVM